MRKVGRTRAKRFLIASVLMVGMVTVGASYAAWNSSLSVNAKIATGSLDFLFRDHVHEKYQASLVDMMGQEKAKLNADFVMEEEGKKVKISFKTGLPLSDLIQGDMIRIDFPLIPSPESTIKTLANREIDLVKEGELVEMKCDRTMVLSNSELYSTDVLGDIFTQDLKFDLYRTVNPENGAEKGAAIGSILLKLRSESIQKLGDLPQTLTFKQSELEKMTTLTDEERQEFQQDGIIATYTCEIPFYLEQKDAEVFSIEE
ncbi:MAG: SipW-dependent-type signal peptide-containing protein [Filifactor alocis]|nr:SipW-dependent-type signal peptide-containing protein [Filifactor alocis]